MGYFIDSLRIRILIYRVEFLKLCMSQMGNMLLGVELMTQVVSLYLLRSKHLELLLLQVVRVFGITTGGYGSLLKQTIESMELIYETKNMN